MKLRFEFTTQEAHQLLAYVEARDHDGGWYYGNKGQFEQRHKRILEELKNLTRSADPTSAPSEKP